MTFRKPIDLRAVGRFANAGLLWRGTSKELTDGCVGQLFQPFRVGEPVVHASGQPIDRGGENDSEFLGNSSVPTASSAAHRAQFRDVVVTRD